MANRQWTAGTKKLRAQIYSRDGTDLTGTVDLSLTPTSTGTDSWQAADWLGTAAVNRIARTTAAIAVTAGTYRLKARLGGAGGEVVTCTPDITVT
jgi:hypothetical protein